MTLNKISSLFLITILLIGCSGGGGGGGGGSAPSKTLVSIILSPANPSISMGTSLQFTATGTYSDSSTQNLTTSVTWGSSAPSVANISNTAGANGLATAVALGTTTISAAAGSITASTTLTVTSQVLVTLVISPTNPSVPLGAAQQFTATGTYSDNSTQNLTTQVVWSSSATAVATISNAAGSNGLASSVAAGTTTISAAAGSITASTTLTVTGGASGNNVMPITVNGSLCSAGSYPNKPCVSVTICTPGTATCQTIDDILLDTGSYGLRIFNQAITVSLPVIAGSRGTFAECVQFGDGSSQWGAVHSAGVILGNEPAVSVPIQVVDATFGTRPTACLNADASPAAAGFNGILGVGLFIQDCGTTCATRTNNGLYYACSGSTCTNSTVPLASQVQNPVALLPQDNNGIILQLPGIPATGSPSANGSLILGIGTQTNNIPSQVTAYPTNTAAEFTTQFGGVSYNSFIDSGSNGLFFTPPAANPIAACSNPNAVWFCPSVTLNLSATNTAASGTHSGLVPFQVGNFINLIGSGNNVFVDIGGTFPGAFDWGLPFFFGRNVFVGFEGMNSSLGTGPYWAY